jgi:hypothetical protein
MSARSRFFRFQQALPPYPGSKWWSLPAIFGLAESERPRHTWPDLTFCDPFLGGGAVSVAGKAQGFGLVLANDLAERSALTGRALVANSSVPLTSHTVLRLYEAPPLLNLAPPQLLNRLPQEQRDFLDRAWRHLLGGTYSGVEGDLIALLLVKWMCRYFPLGLPGATDAPRIVGGDFDNVTGPRLAHYMRRGRYLLQPGTLLAMAQQINRGIIPGEAQVFQMDVFDFLPTVKADIVYLDPPYPNTQDYGHAFGLIDEFLGQGPLPASAFSSRKPPLDDLLAACNHIPVLVMSLGNALLDEEQVGELVARHRRVRRVLSLPYRHYRSVASREKNLSNREFLVLATND